jgi:hypothetical protein
VKYIIPYKNINYEKDEFELYDSSGYALASTIEVDEP